MLRTLITFLLVVATASSDNRPHILYMVIDDVGWADVGFHGSDFPTPVIDRLVDSGVEMSRFYVQPVCSPTRSSMMTGRYAFNMGMQHVTTIKPGSKAHMPTDVKTVADILKENGYDTHMIGKWHLGYASWNYTPTSRGFDTHTGYMGGMIDYYTRNMTLDYANGYDFWKGHQVNTLRNGSYTMIDYLTDADAVLTESASSGNPTFMYFAHQNIHVPLDYPPTRSSVCRDILPTRRAILCDMMSALDTAIGDLIDTYKRLGMWNNTILVTATDNGGMTYYEEQGLSSASSNWPLRGGKTTLFEGGVRGVCFINGGSDAFPSHLKGHKYEGLSHVTDLVPTILSAAGMDMLVREHKFDGVSQWDSITNGKSSPRSEIPINIIWGGRNFTSIISNDMKLIVGLFDGVYDGYWTISPYKRLPPPHDVHHFTRLFNLTEDPLEQNNIVERFPDIVRNLRERISFYVNGSSYSEPQPNDVDPASLPRLHNGVWAPFLN